jgi:hypothetical protein
LLTVADLPNGEFPKNVSKGELFEAADALCNAALLRRKTGDGKPNYGLPEKAIIPPIVDGKSYDRIRQREKWFQ